MILPALLLFLLILWKIPHFLKTEKAPVDLVFIHDFSEEDKKVLDRKLRIFQQLHPEIRLITQKMDRKTLLQALQDENFQVDIMIWNGPINTEFSFDLSTPVRWTGDSWNLVVNTEGIPADALQALKENPDLQEFQWILQRIQEEGNIPISLGNSHLWPLSVWSQHIMMSLNPEEGPDFLPVRNRGNSTQQQAWEMLKSWKVKGYFLESTWQEGWAKGLYSLSTGEAAMGLMSGRMITAIPPENRSNMLYLPFPQASKEDSWVIGTGLSILRNINSPSGKEAEILEAFLISPGITQSLTDELDQLFYDSGESSAQRYIPGWDTLANSPEMREYGKELDSYIAFP